VAGLARDTGRNRPAAQDPHPRHQRRALAVMAVSLDTVNELRGSDYPVNDLCRSRRACWNGNPATAPPADGR
jgi:hypothetical protein